MDKDYYFNRIIKFREIHDENNLEIALFCHRLLRVMAIENPKLKTIRKRLGNTIKDYENKNWSANSIITVAQIKESDLAEFRVNKEAGIIKRSFCQYIRRNC